MHVVMIAAEANPYAKTGGLADVVAALPRALMRRGIDVTVCLPAHRAARHALEDPAPGARLAAPVAGRTEAFEVLQVPEAAVPTVLLRADRYFDRDGIYGASPASDYADNPERFAFFCRAVLEWLRRSSHRPTCCTCTTGRRRWRPRCSGPTPAAIRSSPACARC